MDNIKITYVSPSTSDNTTKIEFSTAFQGTNDNVSGSVNVNNTELSKAYQEATDSDPYAGHKALIANKLTSEFAALNKSTEETN